MGADLEKKLYQNHIRRVLCKIPRLLFERIENSVGCGTPDLTYSYRGHHGWIELKVGEVKPYKLEKRGRTLYVDRVLMPTLRGVQMNWMRTRASLGGGNVFCIVQLNEKAYLFEGTEIRYILCKDIKVAEQYSLLHWDMDANVETIAAALAKIL